MLPSRWDKPRCFETNTHNGTLAIIWPIKVAHGGIRAASSDASTTALSASANGNGFGGAVFSVSAPASSPDASFRLIQVRGGFRHRKTRPRKQRNARGTATLDGSGWHFCFTGVGVCVAQALARRRHDCGEKRQRRTGTCSAVAVCGGVV